MNSYFYFLGLSSNLLSVKPVKIISAVILMVVVFFTIFQLGKDCAKYDTLHSAYLEKANF